MSVFKKKVLICFLLIVLINQSTHPMEWSLPVAKISSILALNAGAAALLIANAYNFIQPPEQDLSLEEVEKKPQSYWWSLFTASVLIGMSFLIEKYC